MMMMIMLLLLLLLLRLRLSKPRSLVCSSADRTLCVQANIKPTPKPTHTAPGPSLHTTPHTTPHPHKAVLQSGVTLISVGHRPTLTQFHKRVLQLAAPGGAAGGSDGAAGGAAWRVCSAEEFAGGSVGEGAAGVAVSAAESAA